MIDHVVLAPNLTHAKNPDPSKMVTLRTLTPASYRFRAPSSGGSLGNLRAFRIFQVGEE